MKLLWLSDPRTESLLTGIGSMRALSVDALSLYPLPRISERERALLERWKVGERSLAARGVSSLLLPSRAARSAPKFAHVIDEALLKAEL